MEFWAESDSSIVASFVGVLDVKLVVWAERRAVPFVLIVHV